MSIIAPLQAPSARRSSHARLFALYQQEAGPDVPAPDPLDHDLPMPEHLAQSIQSEAQASLDRPRVTLVHRIATTFERLRSALVVRVPAPLPAPAVLEV